MKLWEFTRKLGEISRRAPEPARPPATRAWETPDTAAEERNAYAKSEGVREVLNHLAEGAPAILVSGRAGTGKSRLVHHLKSTSEGARTMVVAPTGVAALNVGAQTIHSAFALPFGVIDAERLEKRRLGTKILMLERLVIDEISMVRADMLDGIDVRLRHCRGDPRPFGGVQVVLVGDFLQLPPVTPNNEEAMLANLGYETPFAFSAKALRDIDLSAVTLVKVWRQTDAEFIKALGRIRSGQGAEMAVEWLNARCYRAARPGSQPMLLTPTRKAAEGYNLEGLRARRAERQQEVGLGPLARGDHIGEAGFRGSRTGTFKSKKDEDLPVPEYQILLPGLRVMAVKNDPGEKFVNGSLGTVTRLDLDRERPDCHAVWVLFDGERDPVRVERAGWDDIRHEWDARRGEIVKTAVGQYQQIPLVLGYATTIHKSQGLSLADVRIDLGQGAFAPGQLYVALSRARSVEGLSLVRPIIASDARTDRMLRDFVDWFKVQEKRGRARVTVAGPPT